jgi:hypothetical protein
MAKVRRKNTTKCEATPPRELQLDVPIHRYTWTVDLLTDTHQSRGKLEIHVPSEFDSTRPSVRFHHIHFETSIKAHRLASRLPQPTATPSIQAGADVFHGLKARDDIPVTLQDYLCTEDPPLELHVFTFADATVVTLNFPHLFTDAVGLSKLIENWCNILAGRPPDEVDGFPESDPLDSVGYEDSVEEHQAEENVLSKYKLAGWSMHAHIRSQPCLRPRLWAQDGNPRNLPAQQFRGRAQGDHRRK